MATMNCTPRLLTIGAMARRLHVPATWLRAEALAGRLPHLRAGQRVLFHVDTVEQILLERARTTGKGAQ